METGFMNTENSDTNESNNFFTNLLINLKTQIKILHWLIQVFVTLGKTLNLHIIIKFLPQVGMINFVSLVDCILFQKFKIILSALSKTMRL